MGLLGGRSAAQGPDPWLDVKILLFFVAAALAVVGMVIGSPWTIYSGILVVIAGLLLRFLPRGRGGERPLDEGSHEQAKDESP